MFYAKYDAMDVAEYVLWCCEEKLNKPISNLQLQKILYYIQGENIAENGCPLFDNKIEAWDYGPVVPDVYFSYNGFINNKILGIIPKQENLFKDCEVKIIESVIKAKINKNVWELVDETHEEYPWKKNYSGTLKREIPIEDIERWFREE